MLVMMLAAMLADAPVSEPQQQTAYVECLMRERDSAVRQRVTPDKFAAVAGQLCETETKAYRTIALKLDPKAGAADRFAAADAAQRLELVETYKNRMRARRTRSMTPPMTTEEAAALGVKEALTPPVPGSSQ